MSTTKKNILEIPVETVENLVHTFEWTMSNINFWQLKDIYPCNLLLRESTNWYCYLNILLIVDKQKKSKTVKKTNKKST